MSKPICSQQKGTKPKWQLKQQSSDKRMMRNLLRRNLVLRATTAARKSKSIRPNRLTSMKKMRLSPRN